MNIPINPREKLSLTAVEVNDILDGANQDYEIVSDTTSGKSRWSIHHRLVIKQLSTNRFFADTYSRGATEYQDEQPWQDSEPDFREVFPMKTMVIKYS